MANEITKYTKLGVDKIKDVDILEKKDLTKVAKLSKELQRVFEVKQVWRTETEMRYSVLNDVSHPTPASKYWQCVREQDVFFSNLVQLSCDYQRTQDDFNIKDVDSHQRESYKKRWQEEMNVGRMTNQADLYRHSKANLETMENEENGD
jgi:hypothetical protein